MTDEAMQIWERARREASRFGADWTFLPTAATVNAAAVIAEALAAKDAQIAKLRGTLTLAANRMDRMALEVIHENSARKYEWKEWAEAARRAILEAQDAKEQSNG